MFDTSCWSKFKLSDLFTFFRGKGVTTAEIFENQGDIPCIQSGENNNGIIGYMSDLFLKDKRHTYIKAPFLSVARSGTSGCVHVQNRDSYIGDSVYALKLKEKESISAYIFLATLLNKEQYRYRYGRKVSIEKYIEEFIKLPTGNENKPNWDYIERFINSLLDYSKITTNVVKKKLPLNVSSWKVFKISDLFDIERGTRLTKENRVCGNIPLVTAGETNEGVSSYISNDNMKIYSNVLTIDMFCNCFYRSYEFACDDNILVLFSKFEHNIYILLFLATVISADKYRYAYGRQYRQKNFREHCIKLPLGKNGKPDWIFMENYIKALPYSDKI